MKKVLVIAGPTAVGKSAFAVELARKYDLEVISGDSIQVYQGLDIGSGKVTEEEMDGVKHHLIDILTTKDAYNVQMFQKMAREVIEQSEKPVIICGGTGLYLKACLYDYTFEEEEGESVDPQLEQYDNQTLYEMLVQADPKQAEKIHVNNRRRLLRSLTIYRRNGVGQSSLVDQQEHTMLYDTMLVGCTMERALLYERINQRVEGMFQAGLQKEVSDLLAQGVVFSDACMKGIGYQEWKPYFEDLCSIEDVKKEIQKHSRQFAKRQYTWFNHQMPVNWYDVTDPQDKQRILNEIDRWMKC